MAKFKIEVDEKDVLIFKTIRSRLYNVVEKAKMADLIDKCEAARDAQKLNAVRPLDTQCVCPDKTPLGYHLEHCQYHKIPADLAEEEYW